MFAAAADVAPVPGHASEQVIGSGLTFCNEEGRRFGFCDAAAREFWGLVPAALFSRNVLESGC